mmetsp:Transcript_18506/g.50197  ORF Transcript_18506/g.50197 Transcript_18506/m.50197 type:complete len:113 (+) Transcript_18506:77-415(+)
MLVINSRNTICTSLWAAGYSATGVAVIMCALAIISTGERPFVDIFQDRRYWGIHLVTIPSLFLAGVIFVCTGFVYKLFGTPNWVRYFYNASANISRNLINDRFSVSIFLEDF